MIRVGDLDRVGCATDRGSDGGAEDDLVEGSDQSVANGISASDSIRVFVEADTKCDFRATVVDMASAVLVE